MKVRVSSETVNQSRKLLIGLAFITPLLLSACGGSTAAPTAVTQETELIGKACANLPNLLKWLEWKDIHKPWEVSLQAFSELARLNPGYVQISGDAQKIADTGGPFFSNAKDDNGNYISKEVYAINGLCVGLGSLTPTK